MTYINNKRAIQEMFQNFHFLISSKFSKRFERNFSALILLLVILVILGVILGLFCSSLCSLIFFSIEPSGFETDVLFFINCCDLKYPLIALKTSAISAGACRKLCPKHKPIYPPIFPIRV